MTEKTFYEDTEYVLYPVAFIKTVFISSHNVYRYRIAQANQSVSTMNMQKRVAQLEMIVLNATDFYRCLPHNVSRTSANYILRGIAAQINTVFSVYLTFTDSLRSHEAELREFDRRIRKGSKAVYTEARKYRKIKILSLLNYRLYPTVERFYRHLNK